MKPIPVMHPYKCAAALEAKGYKVFTYKCINDDGSIAYLYESCGEIERKLMQFVEYKFENGVEIPIANVIDAVAEAYEGKKRLETSKISADAESAALQLKAIFTANKSAFSRASEAKYEGDLTPFIYAAITQIGVLTQAIDRLADSQKEVA